MQDEVKTITLVELQGKAQRLEQELARVRRMLKHPSHGLSLTLERAKELLQLWVDGEDPTDDTCEFLRECAEAEKRP